MTKREGPLFELKVTSEPGSPWAFGTVRLLRTQDNHKPYVRVQAMAKMAKFYQPVYKASSDAIRLQGDDLTTDYPFSVPLTYCPPGTQFVLLILTGGRGGEITARIEPPRSGLLTPPLWWRLLNAHRLGGG